MVRKSLRKLLLWLLDKTQQGGKEPFSLYYTSGIDASGQAPIQFIWNKAFVENIRRFGYECETEEETIELFYLATRPVSLAQAAQEDEEIVSEEHPRLSNDTHHLKR